MKINPKDRPLSVSVIGYWLAYSSIAVLIQTILFIPASVFLSNKAPILSDPETAKLLALIPNLAQLVLILVASILTSISGFAILKAHNWGRYLYVFVAITGLLVTLATTPFWLSLPRLQYTIPYFVLHIPGIILMSIMIFFLFRPKANAYLMQHSNEECI